jgi:MinD-like ATPase involved in chromosome partitioning or flagellar assembly
VLIGFSGGKGAPGASLAVVNVGAALAASGRSVIAVDLDPAGGVLSAYLGGEPTRGLWPLARSGEAPSAESLAAQVQILHGLPLIAGLPRASDAAGINLASVARAAAALAPTVLVDAGRLPGDGAGVLEVCDRIVLAVAMDPVGILAAEQALVALSREASSRALLLVMGTTLRDDLRQVGELLGLPVMGGIPWDPDEVRRSRAGQRPLAGKAAKAFGRVARMLSPSMQQPGAPALGREGLVADGA